MMWNPQLSPDSLFANRFELQHAAGRGGMGTIYRAIDRYSGNPVALKLLHDSAGGPAEAERFVREAQLLSELRHPGIVAHIAHGQAPDGQRFLAMEWLDGQDLGERLARGPLPLRDCLRLVEQVAAALSVAHQRGIIHRDLKPTNLFLLGGRVDQVKIVDFGIARRIAGAQAMTRTGMVVGTVKFLTTNLMRAHTDHGNVVKVAIGYVRVSTLEQAPSAGCAADVETTRLSARRERREVPADDHARTNRRNAKPDWQSLIAAFQAASAS